MLFSFNHLRGTYCPPRWRGGGYIALQGAWEGDVLAIKVEGRGTLANKVERRGTYCPPMWRGEGHIGYQGAGEGDILGNKLEGRETY